MMNIHKMFICAIKHTVVFRELLTEWDSYVITIFITFVLKHLNVQFLGVEIIMRFQIFIEPLQVKKIHVVLLPGLLAKTLLPQITPDGFVHICLKCRYHLIFNVGFFTIPRSLSITSTITEFVIFPSFGVTVCADVSRSYLSLNVSYNFV